MFSFLSFFSWRRSEVDSYKLCSGEIRSFAPPDTAEWRTTQMTQYLSKPREVVTCNCLQWWFKGKECPYGQLLRRRAGDGTGRLKEWTRLQSDSSHLIPGTGMFRWSSWLRGLFAHQHHEGSPSFAVYLRKAAVLVSQNAMDPVKSLKFCCSGSQACRVCRQRTWLLTRFRWALVWGKIQTYLVWMVWAYLCLNWFTHKQFCSPLEVRFENCKRRHFSPSHSRADRKEKGHLLKKNIPSSRGAQVYLI